VIRGDGNREVAEAEEIEDVEEVKEGDEAEEEKQLLTTAPSPNFNLCRINPRLAYHSAPRL
jgi:hypothetical protein